MSTLSCEQAQILMSHVLGGEGEAEDLEGHLATCAKCRTQAQLFLRQDRALKEMAAREEIDRVLARIRARLQSVEGHEADKEEVQSSPNTHERALGRVTGLLVRSLKKRSTLPLMAAAALVMIGLVGYLALSERRVPSQSTPPAGMAMPGAPRQSEEARAPEEPSTPVRAGDSRPSGEPPVPAESQPAETVKREFKPSAPPKDAPPEQTRGPDPKRDTPARTETQAVTPPKAPSEQKVVPPVPPDRKEAPTSVPPNAPTVAQVATIEAVEGGVQRVGPAGRTAIRAGEGLKAGEGLQTVGRKSSAVLKLPDGTRLVMEGDTAVRSVSDYPEAGPGRETRGKGVVLSRGTLVVNAVKQPVGQALVVTTPHGEARVVGTRFRLLVDVDGPGFTRLEVHEGKVQLARLEGRSSIEVNADQYAVAAPGGELKARRIASLLSDPGFEKNGLGWTQAPRGGVAGSVVATSPRSGVKALEVSRSQPGMGWRDVYQDVPVIGGKVYEAGGWGRTNKVGGRGAFIRVMWFATPTPGELPLRDLNQVLHVDVLGHLNGTRDWTRLAETLKAPVSAKLARVVIGITPDPESSGTAWIDDLYFARQDE